jgi:hypothetical protein
MTINEPELQTPHSSQAHTYPAGHEKSLQFAWHKAGRAPSTNAPQRIKAILDVSIFSFMALTSRDFVCASLRLRGGIFIERSL